MSRARKSDLPDWDKVWNDVGQGKIDDRMIWAPDDDETRALKRRTRRSGPPAARGDKKTTAASEVR